MSGAERAPALAPVQTLLAGGEDAGQRIDNFLIRHLRGVPRTHIYRILRTGEVRVNSGRVRQGYRLAAGDRVRIPPLRVVSAPPARPSASLIERVEGWILREEDDWLALDKPSGIAVHGGSGLRHGLIEALRAARPQARGLELVHRLDRETSGCLLVAKRRSALRALHQALRSGTVDKRYLALALGRWPRARERVDAPLQRFVLRSGERMVRAGEGGKPARTRFRVLGYAPQATLLEARPVTGRTHQIRVHAALAGNPLAGDPKYGGGARVRVPGLRRLFLHAHALRFAAPGGGEVTICAALPEELREVLARLALEEAYLRYAARRGELGRGRVIDER